MNIQDIQKLEKAELKKLLKELHLYKELTDELWVRWEKLFRRIMNDEKSFQVEYFWAVTESLAWSSAQNVYKKVFDLSPKKEEVEFINKESLKWGIKVYLDDQVVDLSFDKVERAFRGS